MSRKPRILKCFPSAFRSRDARLGFSLIEMVVTMAIIAIGLMGISTVLGVSLKDDKLMQGSLARTNLSANLRKALTHRKSLRNTMLNNPAMKVAVTGAAADYAAVGGRVYSDNRPYGIEIFDTENQVLAGKGADASGAPEAPVYYALNGNQCTTPGVGSCIFKVTATLHIQGEAEYGTADNMVPQPWYPDHNITYKPDIMMVVYKIETLSNPTFLELQRKPLHGSVFISVDDVEGLVP